ncbi:hypothetical protein SGRIM128S_06082 [Streptomyces griseomycini]
MTDLTFCSSASSSAPASSAPAVAFADSRSSVSLIVRPLLRNAISWKRRESVSKEYSVVSKMSGSAQKVTEVPVTSVASCWASGAVGTPIL